MERTYYSVWVIVKTALAAHIQSSRFIIIMHAIWLSFAGALVKAFWSSFPFEVFVGVLNGSLITAYIAKTREPGAHERRNLKEGKSNE